MGMSEAEQKLKAAAGRTANILYAHMMMNIVGISMVLQGRPPLVLANSAGSTRPPAAAARASSSRRCRPPRQRAPR